MVSVKLVVSAMLVSLLLLAGCAKKSGKQVDAITVVAASEGNRDVLNSSAFVPAAPVTTSAIELNGELGLKLQSLQSLQASYAALLKTEDAAAFHQAKKLQKQRLSEQVILLSLQQPLDAIDLPELHKTLLVFAADINASTLKLQQHHLSQCQQQTQRKKNQWQVLAAEASLAMPAEYARQIDVPEESMHSRDLKSAMEACHKLIVSYRRLLSEAQSLIALVAKVESVHALYVQLVVDADNEKHSMARLNWKAANKAAANGNFSLSIKLYKESPELYREAYKQWLVQQAMPAMVAVAGGEFIMGDERGNGHEDESPLHERSVSDFALAESETSVRQFQAFLNYQTFEEISALDVDNGELPVVDVTFAQSVAFTRWLSERTGESYRLPREYEWEFVAKRQVWVEGEIKSSHCEGCQGWGNKAPMAVKSYPASNGGLYDLLGNVWEWVDDCYQFSYSKQLQEQASDSVCSHHVVRGGSWADMPNMLRVSNRSIMKQEHSARVGFRLAKSL